VDDLAEYLADIMDSTIKDFEEHPTSKRRAFLACVTVFHAILADPRNEWTLADRYATDEMLDRLPERWSAERYRIHSAPAKRLLADHDVVDLGDRHFEVVGTPGHSPGGIGLFERATGIFLSGDIVYDGPLIDDAYHSDPDAYVVTLETRRRLPVSIVHGGHFPSFGPTRYRQLIHEYLAGWRMPAPSRLNRR
jgi:glyoxylase-like metal-dependent hydrolase (beta-lactamase superfamily II)